MYLYLQIKHINKLYITQMLEYIDFVKYIVHT